jgi:hypothetical protein
VERHHASLRRCCAGGCLFRIVGNYTYTVPAGVASIRVTVVGGGGSGARDHSSWHAYGGAGGGAAIKTLPVSPGQSFNLKVGPGGNSANSDFITWCNCSGFDGSASSFSTILFATGGQGGFRNGASQQAKGGTGTGGDQNCSGGNGTEGTDTGAVGLPGQCGGGAGGLRAQAAARRPLAAPAIPASAARATARAPAPASGAPMVAS